MRRFGYDDSVMRHLAILFIHLIVTIARLFGPGGARSVVAESLLVKHQLLIINRSRERAPVLRPTDRLIVWAVCNLDAPYPLATFSHRSEALHDSQLPSSIGET